MMKSVRQTGIALEDWQLEHIMNVFNRNFLKNEKKWYFES